MSQTPSQNQTDVTAESISTAQHARVIDFLHDHPTDVGPYHILGVIGQGGMGIVYKAEQREPVRRVVALKLIKLGMDTADVIARFEGERQALAVMNHPGVAKVLDAGATERGRPYFVMEHVAGEPITTFCDRAQLPIARRLELFAQACDAIQHAHQKAIIHRDLKPSNILVSLDDGKPIVKVIDFGVAKAVSQRLTERTLFTETGQLIGTPEYMSPEQADTAGADVDTRTDIYALGVVLYELLAGALPFDAGSLRSAGYHEIQRIIREVDPPRPSTRLSSLGRDATDVAQKRRTHLAVLEKQLRTELEWIPLKAMRKDRTERYATAAELATDVRNYLASRPLQAGPPSATYRLRKFIRRNKTGVAASAAMLLLLIAGIVATAWQAFRATRAERATRAALAQVEDANANQEAVIDFLTIDVLGAAKPAVTMGRPMTVLEALDRAAGAVADRVRERPFIESNIRFTLGDVYHELGRADLALPHVRAAYDIARRLHGDDGVATLRCATVLAKVLATLGKLDEAEALYRRVHGTRRRWLGEDHPETLEAMGNLGGIDFARGRFAEAERTFRHVLERGASSPRPVGYKERDSFSALNNLASVLRVQGKLAEAEQMFRRSAEERARVMGRDHPLTLLARGNLAEQLLMSGKVDEADVLLEELLASARRVLGDDHPQTVITANSRARVLEVRGSHAEAEQLYRDVIARARRVFGDEHPTTLIAINNLGSRLKSAGRFDEAEPLYREAMESLARVLGPEHSSAITSLHNMATLLIARGDFASGEPLLRRALDARRRVLGENHADTLGSLSHLALMLEAQGRLDEAEPAFADLYRRCATAQVNPAHAALYMAGWGPCLVKLERWHEADAPLREAYRRLLETRQQRSPRARAVLAALVEVCEETNRVDDAVTYRAELAALHAPTRPTSVPATPPTTASS